LHSTVDLGDTAVVCTISHSNRQQCALNRLDERACQ
jgi:hypothetical protein